MLEVTFVSALIGGILTFFAPCTLPIVPGYLSFLGGASQTATPTSSMRRRLMGNALLFVLGFSLVFITYGAASGAFGQFLVINRDLLSRIGGIFIMLLGVTMIDSQFLGQLFSRFTLKLPGIITAGSSSGAFALGLFFALGWSPCLGPVLGTIILLAGSTGTISSGMLLLATYALGLAIPFLLVAYFFGTATETFPRLERSLAFLRRLGGLVLVVMGALLVFGQLGLVSTWFFAAFGIQEFDAMIKYL